MPDSPIEPLLLALIAAFLFGTSALVGWRGLRRVEPQTGSMVSIATSAAIFAMASPLFMESRPVNVPALLVFALMGMFQPALSLFFSYEGLSRLGATISATVASTAPLFAAAAAIAVLGEHPTPAIAVGTLGIVAGVIVLSWRGKLRRDWRPAALLYPTSAAFIRGTVNIGMKYGLSLMPAPYTAGLVAYLVATVVAALIFLARGRRFSLGSMGPGMGWFLGAGTLNCLATFCLFSALQTGQVIVVVPILSAYPLFTWGAGLLFRLERFSLRVSLAVVLVVGGVMLVALR
jgi:drug/metabolite transporter (DMT)-like permease